MELRLLGPVEAVVDGAKIPLRRRQERCLLAILALEAGRFVAVERLVDLLWDEQPPPRARGAIQAMVSHLRLALQAARASGVQLLTQRGGYILEIDADQVDLHRFRSLVGRARAAGSSRERVRLLGSALALWRGPPLADAATQTQRARLCPDLDELHLAAREEWLQARLDLGDHHELVEQLTRLVAEHPLRERPPAQLMLALYRCGRRADALEVYRQARHVLVEELGLEPGQDLQRLEHAILVDDPALSVAGPDRDAQPVPAQLPADVRAFVGRAEHLAQMDTFLADGDRHGAPAPAIYAITGTAGVGKTTLAVHWAHQIRARFPDGQIYVNLRGFGPGTSAMRPAEAIRVLLDALKVPGPAVPSSFEAQVGLYRSLVDGRRMLIVLDNASDTEQVRPLLPGTPGCLAVVTSRHRLTGLIAAGSAQVIALDLLSLQEAREFLTRRLGPARVAAEPGPADQIIVACARLPIALAVTAAYATARPGFSLATVAARLREARSRLAVFDSDDTTTDVRAVFSWSYQALSTDAARLFRFLSVHNGPDIALPAAASLLGNEPDRVAQLLAELTAAHLLTEQLPGRYAFHDLLRAYATELARTLDSDTERRAALHRMVDHYLHAAHTAARRLRPDREPIGIARPEPGVIAEEIADDKQALAWLTAEHPVLLSVVRQATDGGLDTHVWQLAWALADFHLRRGYWREHASLERTALDATQRLGDRRGQAYTHRELARAYLRLSRHDEAHVHFQHALDLFELLGEHASCGHTHRSLAFVLGLQGHHHEALRHARRALEISRATGDRGVQAQALNSVGWCHAQLGSYPQALRFCRQALDLFQKLGNRGDEAETWDSLGYIHHRLGEYEQAAACYQQALRLFREVGDRYQEADTLTKLGDTLHATGDHRYAREAWQDALAVLDQLRHTNADQVRRRLDDLDCATECTVDC